MSQFIDTLSGKIASNDAAISKLVASNKLLDGFLNNHSLQVTLWSNTQGYEDQFNAIDKASPLTLRLSNKMDIKYSAEVTGELIQLLRGMVFIKFNIACLINTEEALDTCKNDQEIMKFTTFTNAQTGRVHMDEFLGFVDHIAKKYSY